MTIKTVEIQEAQTRLKELLELAREGTEIILVEGSIPLARLVPVESGQRIPDLHPGGWMSDDFTDPLPDEFWTGEGVD